MADVIGVCQQEWIDLRGDDGKVKARLNKATGELVIKERKTYHHWSLPALIHMPESIDTNLTSC